MPKGYAYELLGVHVHSELSPQGYVDHGATTLRTQPPLRLHTGNRATHTTTKRNRHNQYRTQTSKGAQAQPTQLHVSNHSGICHTLIKICCINDGVEYNTPDILMLDGILITDMLLQYHIYIYIYSIEALATSK